MAQSKSWIYPLIAWWIFPYSYVNVYQTEGKSPFSYGFPMVFLWFSYGFPIENGDFPSSQYIKPSHIPGVPFAGKLRGLSEAFKNAAPGGAG